MEPNDVVIVSAVRTPVGKFGGTLKDFRSIDLGALVIKECLIALIGIQNRCVLSPRETGQCFFQLG